MTGGESICSELNGRLQDIRISLLSHSRLLHLLWLGINGNGVVAVLSEINLISAVVGCVCTLCSLVMARSGNTRQLLLLIAL
jgi:hypothetical protein